MNKTDRIKQVQHVRGGGVSPHIDKTLIYNISHYLNRIIHLHIYILYCGLIWNFFPTGGPLNGRATITNDSFDLYTTVETHTCLGQQKSPVSSRFVLLWELCEETTVTNEVIYNKTLDVSCKTPDSQRGKSMHWSLQAPLMQRIQQRR